MNSKLKTIVEQSDQVAAIFKTISHPGRLLILCYLIEGEKTVSDLEELCSLPQSQVSQFLKRMLYEELVTCRKVGKYAFYRIKDNRLGQLMASFSEIYLERSQEVAPQACP